MAAIDGWTIDTHEKLQEKTEETTSASQEKYNIMKKGQGTLDKSILSHKLETEQKEQ